jgi:hypothetical protein
MAVQSSHSLWNGAIEGRRKRRPEMHERVGAISRWLRAIGRDFTSGDEDVYGLEVFHQLREVFDDTVEVAVQGLRAQGYSDREIGEAIGIQQPGVWKRYPRE